MQKRLVGIIIFSFIFLISMPAYGELAVSTVSLDKAFYTNDESLKFVGTTNGTDRSMISVIIKNPGDKYVTMLGDPISDPDGTFETIPKKVSDIFTSIGTYTAIAFTGEQNVEDGITILLEYNGSQVSEGSAYVLTLNSISDRIIDEEKTVSFSATIKGDPVEGVVFSLGESAPSGATIDSETGQFVWTTTELHGGSVVTFDIIATLGAQEDRETIKITVNEVDDEPIEQPTEAAEPEPTPEPEPEPAELGIASFVDETKDPQSYVDRYNSEDSYKEWFDKNFPEYSSIYEAVGLDEPLVIPAPFVDETKDPQSYVDRYDNEPKYKEWFDKNFPEYSSIYEAVGLDEPKEIAAFVDPNLDPQYYVDRYDNEPKYKEWFDKTYPNTSIYDAVGLEDPTTIEPEEVIEEIGECGPGTELVNGICELVDETNTSEGGGCLIATATFGSEMSPQVQLLREIRDNKVSTTESGESFMTSFNQFYYSFSPYVADYERENPLFKEVVKLGITPMLSTLSILSVVDIDSEEEMLGYGIGIILMNVGMYIVAPAIVIYGIRKTSVKF